MDIAIFNFINQECSSSFLDKIMPVLTNMGFLEFAAAVVFIVFYFNNKRVRVFGLSLCLSLASSYLVVEVLRNIVRRPRPFELIAQAHVLTHVNGYSFPSAHAACIFTGTTLLCVYFQRFYYFFIFAFLVAFSRVYLGVHFPSDVVAGALVGIISGASFGKIGKEVIKPILDISKVTDYLYVGSQIRTEYVDEIKLMNFNLIISMIGQRAPPEIYSLPPFKTLWIKTYDYFFTPISIQKMLIGVEAALPVIENKGKVLVFCMEGRHRSIAMAAAILIGMGHRKEEAISLLTVARKVADPRIWYIRERINAFEHYWLTKK